MSSIIHRIKPLIKEILNEIGEGNLIPLKWDKLKNNQYKFEIDIKEEILPIIVDFENFDEKMDKDGKSYYIPQKFINSDNTWNVGYNIKGNENQYKQSDMKTLLSIMSTIVNIIKDFIKNNKPDCFYVEGTPKNMLDDKIQKKNLYKAYIWKQFDNYEGYGVEVRRDGFLICKK